MTTYREARICGDKRKTEAALRAPFDESGAWEHLLDPPVDPMVESIRYLRRDREGERHIRLWLAWSDEDSGWYVCNAVPVAPSPPRISVEEYNRVVNDFVKVVLRPRCPDGCDLILGHGKLGVVQPRGL